MAYDDMKGFASFSDSWANDAVQNSLKAAGTYSANNALAKEYNRLDEDTSSRVDDGEGWRAIAKDSPPKNAEEYEALVKKWSDAGYDVRAIDMDEGFTHSNIAVKPAGADGGDGSDEDPIYKLSPQIQGALERSAAYRERRWSGQEAQDIYGKSKELAEGNTLGINSGKSETSNAAFKAADTETDHQYFNKDKYRMDLARDAKQRRAQSEASQA